jgi:hypothetical protein
MDICVIDFPNESEMKNRRQNWDIQTKNWWIYFRLLKKTSQRSINVINFNWNRTRKQNRKDPFNIFNLAEKNDLVQKIFFWNPTEFSPFVGP